MRRITMLLATMAVMVPLFAAVAYAATIEGSDKGEILIESDRNDTIFGRGGGDIIDATIFGGDRDVVFGNAGDDEMSVEDGDGRDTLVGGNGFDRCFGDPNDDLDCEVENQ